MCMYVYVCALLQFLSLRIPIAPSPSSVSVSPMSVSAPVTRPLFGGAITLDLPPRFEDCR